ncbi:hypothetical protein [Flavobacterium lacus]|uniref:Uncharacterized protein n=1 Tax=Flavobacterium lacus TaxID=1353778 RepID=A0A328X2Z5_9FLAO|nr:hypothetical protein [Flavobacterium lacus]RAR50927.1 hypothetical protein B0I10_10198 [Flavobacterium lacus]
MKIQSTKGTSTKATTILSWGPDDENLILKINLRENKNDDNEYYLRQNYFSKSAYIDYYCYRLLYLTDNSFFLVSKLVKTAADCLEKLLKLFLLTYNPALDIKKLSHNLDKIVSECKKIDDYFDKPELNTFCDEYSQKLGGFNGHQIFGYSDNTVIESWETDCSNILNLLDEVFLETLLRMKNNYGFFAFDLFEIYLERESTKSRYNLKFTEVKSVLFTRNNFIHSFYLKNEKNIIENTIPI